MSDYFTTLRSTRLMSKFRQKTIIIAIIFTDKWGIQNYQIGFIVRKYSLLNILKSRNAFTTLVFRVPTNRNTLLQNSEAVARMCSVKNVFLKIAQNSQ